MLGERWGAEVNRIDKKFKELRKAKKKAFIVFITAGYPDLNTTYKLILEFSRIGVDIIELGVPFTDPMADGPVIQESSQKALEKGADLDKIFNLVRKARLRTGIPIGLMTYYNPVFCMGEGNFLKRAKNAGVDGVIIPDLPPEEGKGLVRKARKIGIDTVFFVSPTSSTRRIKLNAQYSSGFIYYVSLTGTTGARKKISQDLAKNIRAIKKLTLKPVCAGFGISNAAQVKEVNRFADGVIVGSAVVNKIRENLGKPGLASKVSRFVSGLRG
ncbi:MAG: tryptophan synthase subunit alpha [Candidatus Omnitrophica bacterium]|nr:tryptophan synthase subunit alpha [Candidatus Omnitrophota bacterium]